MSVGLTVQEKKLKIDIKDGGHSGHFGVYIGTILAFLMFKSPRCFLPSFKSVGLSFQEKKHKIDFQDGGHGGHFGFPFEIIFAIVDLQVTPMFLIKFQVN